MNDLDDRLRATLHQLADAVPPSPHPRADLERRLVRRPARRSLLIAAAAAVVVAAVAVPVALSRQDSPSPQRVATAPPSTSESSESTAPKPGDMLAGPVELGRFVENGATRVVVLTVRVDELGREEWCVANVDEASPKDSTGSGGDCAVVDGWPTQSPPGGLVLTRGVLSQGNVLPSRLLFVTTPQATTLEVQNGAGQPVQVRQVAATAGARYYLVDFGGTSGGFGYTAKDAAGNVLVTAIT
jgi:hypothetical protein